jgi:hypothetical protein
LWWRITASPLSMSCRAGRFDCNRNIIQTENYGFKVIAVSSALLALI